MRSVLFIPIDQRYGKGTRCGLNSSGIPCCAGDLSCLADSGTKNDGTYHHDMFRLEIKVKVIPRTGIYFFLPAKPIYFVADSDCDNLVELVVEHPHEILDADILLRMYDMLPFGFPLIDDFHLFVCGSLAVNKV